jgi:hypothetical protein
VDPHVLAAPGTPPPVVRAARLEEVPGQYDVVLASGVLEHTAALYDILIALFSRIAPGGWFYARTPWTAPLARLLPGADPSFPAHLHDLGALFWDRIVALLAVRLVVVRSQPSIRQHAFRRKPVAAIAATVLKSIGHLQSRGAAPRWRWPFVGGWEVLLHRPLPR